jgi:hypothetical protein
MFPMSQLFILFVLGLMNNIDFLEGPISYIDDSGNISYFFPYFFFLLDPRTGKNKVVGAIKRVLL